MLEAGRIGRVGITVDGRPVIYPVNYVVFEGNIYIITRQGGDLHTASLNGDIAFEVDGADPLYHEGWSVLVVGHCSPVTDQEELNQLAHLPLSPWAGEDRDLLLRLPIEKVSGRHIHHRAT
jgi:nitroimidazol reductase NimA-like FMN-containing flavoprotein (pyridoxamine 5'-phosphate oxidase superfamily)